MKEPMTTVNVFDKPVPQQMLLNSELRAKTEAKVAECMNFAKQKWPDKEFPIPEIFYDVKNTVGGLAYYNEYKLRFNLVLFYENFDFFLATTVVHECVHLICNIVHGKYITNADGDLKKIRPHGKEWKEIMVMFGIPPNTYHHYNTTSVEKPNKKKRAVKGKEGYLLGILVEDISKTLLMHKRLQNGVKRLTQSEKQLFAIWLNDHINEK